MENGEKKVNEGETKFRRVLETPDARAEKLIQEFQRAIQLAENGEAFRIVTPIIGEVKKGQLISQITPGLVDLVFLISYWEEEGKGEKTHLEQIKERLEKVKGLQESGDSEGLFNWVQEEKYRYQEQPSGMTQVLDRLRWIVGGRKYREEMVTRKVNFLQQRVDELQGRLERVEHEIRPTEREEKDLETHQALVTDFEEKIKALLEQGDIPGSFDKLQLLKNEVEKLTAEVINKRIATFYLGAKLKTLAQRIYERNADRNISFRRREEVTEMAKEILEEELASAEGVAKFSVESFSELAELSKGRILLRMSEEVGRIIQEYPQIGPEKSEEMIDQLSKLAIALGFDDIDVRRRFKRDKKGRVIGFYDESLGGVLKALAEQVEMGIDFRGQGVKISRSIGEALGSELASALEGGVLLEDQEIPDEAKVLRSYIDPKTGKLLDVGAYEAVASHFLKDESKPPKETHFRLLRYNDQLLVVLEHNLNDQLSILQIMDPEISTSGTSKQSWINVRHLLLISRQTGRVFDIATLVPKDFTLRYIPDSSLYSFKAEYGRYSELYPERFIQFGDLTSVEGVIALLHEIGHHIVTTNSDPKLAKKAQELWEKSQFQVGGASGMPKEEFIRTKELLVANERGASARALWLLRKLRQEGINIGVRIKEIGAFLDAALLSYEKGYPQLYPECGIRFTRKI